MISKTLAHYKIIDKLGEGGMGEVYRVEDTKLGRHVAIKVLPEIFAKDKERLARFEREAKMLASLNHPNIAAIHGLEEAEGERFLVMELIKGETLAQKLDKGALQVDESLEVCGQIAEAVEVAHEKGIIHRDLKPANVKITPEGRVKVLDFGLAKALYDEETGADISKSPTLTAQMTQPGVILGTAAYMSPEQAKGKAVDKRTDIWSFGCLLFECLTGNLAFKGETVSDTLASILKEEPDWKALPGSTPQKILETIRRCLIKDTRNRLQHVGDARILLNEALRDPDAAIKTTGTKQRLSSRSFWMWLMVCLLVGIGIGALLLSLFRSSPPISSGSQMQYSFTFELEEREQIAVDMDVRLFDISANGETIAWIGPRKPHREIFYRNLNDLEVRVVPGTQGVENLNIALSPDGTEVSFVRDATLWKISLKGGTPQKLFEGTADSSIWNWDWGEDGSIVLNPAWSGLVQISGPGADPEILTALNEKENEIAHTFPVILPDQRGVLFTVSRGSYAKTHIEVLEFGRSSSRRRLNLNNVYCVEYASTGHLLFGRGGTLFAAPFDLETLTVTGPEMSILSNIHMDENGLLAEFAVSRNGTLVYVPEQGLSDLQLAWIDRQGRVELLPFSSQPYRIPRISPSGEHIAVGIQKEGSRGWTISLLDMRRTITTELTQEGCYNGVGAWSSDGIQLVVILDHEGPGDVYLMDLSYPEEKIRLTNGSNPYNVNSWSRDGGSLILTERLPLDTRRLMRLKIEETMKQPVALTIEENNEAVGALSPDGLWLAYVSDWEGQSEVYIRSMTGTIREKASHNGGSQPAWSPDGKELFYMKNDQTEFLSVEVKAAAGLELGRETVVFKETSEFEIWKHEMLPRFVRSYDVHPNGRKFLFPVKKKSNQKMKIGVITNWFEELKKKVPTGK
jgi:serine/threonine-protein kinase